METQPSGIVGRILRSRHYLPVSFALMLVLIAGTTIELLARLGWQPQFGSSAPALVITHPSATPATIHGEVLGAVQIPGIYPLADGSRIRDLIEAAGGPLTDANLSGIDTTVAVTDGTTIYVPHVGETPPLLIGGKVNINVASATDLHNALGISVTEAKRIVSYRQQHGEFHAVSDLLLVPVSQTIFDRIRALVTV